MAMVFAFCSSLPEQGSMFMHKCIHMHIINASTCIHRERGHDASLLGIWWLICHICAAGMVNAGYLEVNGDTAESLSPCSPFWVPRFCVLTHNSRLYYFQSREHVPKHEGVLSLG